MLCLSPTPAYKLRREEAGFSGMSELSCRDGKISTRPVALRGVAEEAVNHPQAGRAAFGPLWPEERAVGGPWGAHSPNARLEAGNSESQSEGQWALGTCVSRPLVGWKGNIVVMTCPRMYRLTQS